MEFVEWIHMFHKTGENREFQHYLKCNQRKIKFKNIENWNFCKKTEVSVLTLPKVNFHGK
jgi:hypothetical protein